MLTIEGEKLKQPLVCLRTRGVLSPVFESESGEDGLVIALEDAIVRDKGMDSALFFELNVWGGSELGNAKFNKKKGITASDCACVYQTVSVSISLCLCLSDCACVYLTVSVSMPVSVPAFEPVCVPAFASIIHPRVLAPARACPVCMHACMFMRACSCRLCRKKKSSRRMGAHTYLFNFSILFLFFSAQKQKKKQQAHGCTHVSIYIGAHTCLSICLLSIMYLSVYVCIIRMYTFVCACI